MIHSDLKEEYLFLDSNGSDFGITKIDKKPKRNQWNSDYISPEVI